MSLFTPKSGLEMLEALERRKKLLRNKDVPLEHEIDENLGIELGKIILKQMSPNALILMNADTKHEMKNFNLWIPPARRAETVYLVNANKFDELKATSHQGVLEIGENVEKKFEKHRQKIIKKKLTENTDFERFECKRKVKTVIENQKEYYSKQIQKNNEIFHQKLQQQKEKIELHYQKKCDRLVNKVVADCSKSLAYQKTIYEQNDGSSCLSEQIEESCEEIINTADKMTSSHDLQVKPSFNKNHMFYNKNMCTIMHFSLCAEKFKKITESNLLNSIDVSLLTQITEYLNDIYTNVHGLIAFTSQNDENSVFSGEQKEFIRQMSDTESKFNNVSQNSIYSKIMCLIMEKICNISEIVENITNSINAAENNIPKKIIQKVTCSLIMPEEKVKDLFCMCSSSSLNTISESGSAEDKEIIDNTHFPNAKWDEGLLDEPQQSSNIKETDVNYKEYLLNKLKYLMDKEVEKCECSKLKTIPQYLASPSWTYKSVDDTEFNKTFQDPD